MKSICLDFDGVINSYTSPFTTPNDLPDPPMPGAFAFIRQLLSNDFNVFIMSARFPRLTDLGDSPDKWGPRGLESVIKWFIKHGAQDLIDITMQPKVEGKPSLFFTINKPKAVLYIDDRAFKFEGSFPSLEYIATFLPWTPPGGANGEWK